MTSNSRVEHEKKLTIGTDSRGSFVTLELEIRHEGPEKTTTDQPVIHRTTDGQDVTEWRELSISGTSRNGGGQMNKSIREELPEYKSLAIPRENIIRILDIWDEWHLNGMESACDHQRKNWGDLYAKIEQTSYQIEWNALRKLEKDVRSDFGKMAGMEAPKDLTTDLARLKAATKWSGAADLLLTVRLLGIEAFSWKVIDPKLYKESTAKLRGWNKSRLPSVDEGWGDKSLSDYIKTKTESKGINWVRPSESPRGILGKPCEVCGYKYGSAWLIRALPAEIEAETVQLFTVDAPAITAESEIDDFAKRNNIGYSCEKIKERPDGFGENMTRHFKCQITHEGRNFTLYFSQGEAHTEDPTLSDVLECLGSDFSGVDDSFENWASELGYDSDSRSAAKIYATTKRQSKQLRKVLGEKLYKRMMEQNYAV